MHFPVATAAVLAYVATAEPSGLLLHPSCPSPVTWTEQPLIAVLSIPATYAVVCLPSVPMRVVPESLSTPTFEMSTLLLPSTCAAASLPIATLLVPVMLLISAESPKATLKAPAVLCCSAPPPTAVLLLTVLSSSAPWPNAELYTPVLSAFKALYPNAELLDAVVFDNSASLPLATLRLPCSLAASAR